MLMMIATTKTYTIILLPLLFIEALLCLIFSCAPVYYIIRAMPYSVREKPISSDLFIIQPPKQVYFLRHIITSYRIEVTVHGVR
jgi:hypothetical protein